MPLTPTGWDPINFPEVRAGVVALWKRAYGENADTDPNTPDGLEISLIAMSLALAFEVNTGLWANSFFRSAEGVSLDRILDIFAKGREPAVKSAGTAVFYGSPTTPIPALSVVTTADTSANRFLSDAASQIGADDNSDAWVVRVLGAENGVTYTAQVDAQVPSAYVAGPADTVVDVATGLRDDTNADGFATAALAGVDSSGNALLVIEIIGGLGNISVTDDSPNTVIDAFEAVRVAVTALEAGPVPAAAGTLRTLATPIGGVVGVTNDADATIGRDEESDDEYRARHLQTLFANSARTDGGMQATVAALEGIEANLVVSNRLVDPFDADGRPIGSVENIVLVTEINPALDVDIANAIARQIPAGIRPYGLRSFGLGTTIDGEVIEVYATDVEQLYLHLSITVVAGEGFPTGDMVTAIKSAVAEYFDAGRITTNEKTIIATSAKLVIGKDWTQLSTSTPINVVTQNSSVDVQVLSDATAAPGDAPSFVDVALRAASTRQIYRVDASRIAVNIVT